MLKVYENYRTKLMKLEKDDFDASYKKVRKTTGLLFLSWLIFAMALSFASDYIGISQIYYDILAYIAASPILFFVTKWFAHDMTESDRKKGQPFRFETDEKFYKKSMKIDRFVGIFLGLSSITFVIFAAFIVELTWYWVIILVQALMLLGYWSIATDFRSYIRKSYLKHHPEEDSHENDID